MRSVRITGGFGGDVEVTLTDRKAQNLGTATFKIGLIPVDGGIPEANSTVWKTPDAKDTSKVGTAVLVLRPAQGHALGRFWPHVLVIDSGRPPELIRATDYVELT